MKLRNKKTGEIAEPFGITCMNGRTFVKFDDGKGTFKFEAHSLAELNEEWEDYEEPKEYWAIDWTRTDGVSTFKDSNDDIDKFNKSIGNYFKTKEEAEKAVEKLKAWKRLKDKGFRFDYVGEYENLCGNGFEIPITATMPPEQYNNKVVAEDLRLLFGGEE